MHLHIHYIHPHELQGVESVLNIRTDLAGTLQLFLPPKKHLNDQRKVGCEQLLQALHILLFNAYLFTASCHQRAPEMLQHHSRGTVFVSSLRCQYTRNIKYRCKQTQCCMCPVSLNNELYFFPKVNNRFVWCQRGRASPCLILGVQCLCAVSFPAISSLGQRRLV